MKMALNEIASAMHAESSHRDMSALIESVSTDSRSITPGQLFFCLTGEHFDGHDYAYQAARAGAAAVVAERPLDEVLECPVLMVRDSLIALGRLALAWRRGSGAKVIGVTGTAGKTTVKELLASILAQAGRTAKSLKNFNNRIGLPLCILATDGQEDFWVMEAGISEAGEMDFLGAIMEPDLAIITNAGPGHLSGLGSTAGVAANKVRLFSHLRPQGQGLLNMDCPELMAEALAVLPAVKTFSSRDALNTYFGAYLGLAPDGSGYGRFNLKLGGAEIELLLPRRGVFWAENCIAAAAPADMLGLKPELIKKGLEEAVFPEQRFMCHSCGNWLLIDDSYNANPLSMRAALAAASEMAEDRPLVCVLGEMRELGQDSMRLHRELGGALADSGCQAVFWRGDFAEAVREGLDLKNWSGCWFEFDTPENFQMEWNKLPVRSGVLLVKGSRANHLDKTLGVIREEAQSCAI